MNWYRCAKANCPHVVMHEQIFVAPTTQEHNHVAVAAFVDESLCDLKNRFGVQVKDVINWSDNCLRQFKSRGPFFWLSKEPVPSMLSFLGECHGKNDDDGVTGRTKCDVNRAWGAREAFIQTAKDFYNYCHDK